MEETQNQETKTVTFDEFGFSDQLMESLDAMNFQKPTPIQQQAIPVIMEGKDLIACAQTGTGKTGAYLLPILHKLTETPTEEIDTLILAPTRELVLQIDQALTGFSYFCSVSSMAIYGGGDGGGFEREKTALTKGANVIVATPGKIISHLNLGYVKIQNLRHFILDEADRMLDMGFLEDILKVINFLPAERQNLLFSATMPNRIRDLAAKILIEPAEISLAISKPAERIVQAAFSVYDPQKIPLLVFLLSAKELQSVIVFCSTKSNTKAIEKELIRREFKARAIHSDLEQADREQVLRDFKNHKLNILVATDILSRGIDIENIDLVINVDVPHDAEDYVHRIGRTARAAASGVAFTFINPDEQYKFNRIEELIEKEVPKAKLPESIGEGPVYDPKSRRGGGGGRGRGKGGPKGGSGGYRKKKGKPGHHRR